MSNEPTVREDHSIPVLPCEEGEDGGCPYDYSLKPDRDVEGMPFLDADDPRTCPEYGHACPKFMEDFGLTVDDLNIRAVLHCGALREYLIEKGERSATDPGTDRLRKKYCEYLEKYPEDKYPQYY